MSMPEYFEILENHAVFRPLGRVSLRQAVMSVTEAISYAREQKIRNLLVVASGLTGFESPSLATRFIFVQEWVQASRSEVRIAMVVRSEMIDPKKFGTTVAVNRGLVGDVFASEEEALAWLQSLP